MENKMRFNEEDIKEVMRSYPDLSPNGFLCEYFLNDRASMVREDFKKQVNNAADYIDSCPGPMSKIGSYGLKHRAERWCGSYISNGAFIVAGVLLGYRPKRYPDSPNCIFAKRPQTRA